VSLWAEGIVQATLDDVQPDGSIYVKIPWWRGVTGSLELSARRLDGPTGQVRVSVPTGYGQTSFQASSIYFSAPGCWEVTGRVGSVSLTFVTLLRAP
jgi:hypothetical protein